MSDSFKQKIQSNNGHYYMKMLKEQIAEELKLTEPAKITDYSWDTINSWDPRLKVDAESKFNMSTLSNDTAVGYDNIE
jgi:hypothetical protein